MDTNTPIVTEKKKVGPIVATLIIVLVLIITALYIFAARLNSTQTDLPTDDILSATATTTTVTPVTNTSDDPAAIQKDLDSSNI